LISSTVRVGDLGRVVTGRTPPAAHPEYWGDDVPFLTPSDMDGSRIVQCFERRLSNVGAAAMRNAIVPYGVGVSCIGWQMGKAVYIPSPVLTNQQINTIVFDRGTVDGLFLYYVMSSRREEIFRLGSGGSRTPILNKSFFEDITIELPALSVQRPIASLLSDLDSKIELNRQVDRTLEELASALFTSWFVNFEPVQAKRDRHKTVGVPDSALPLFPEHFEDSELGPIPMGWRVGSIYEVCNVCFGVPFASGLFNKQRMGLPLIRIRDLEEHAPEVFTTEEHPKATLVNAGDIVVGMDGEFRAHIWRGARSLLNQRVCKFVPHANVAPVFLYFALLEPLADEERSKVGTTVSHLNKDDIDRFRTVLPTRDILEAFATHTEHLVRLRLHNELECRSLAELREVLIPSLLSGKVTIKHAEKFIAEVA
jgi:type I restriction enzyme S subunit